MRPLRVVLRIIIAGVFCLSLSHALNAATIDETTRKLFDAVWQNNLPEVQAAIGEGADPSAHNENGLSAVDIAVDKGYFEIAHYILAAQQRPAAGRPAGGQVLDVEPQNLASAPIARVQALGLDQQPVGNTIAGQSPLIKPKPRTKLFNELRDEKPEPIILLPEVNTSEQQPLSSAIPDRQASVIQNPVLDRNSNAIGELRDEKPQPVVRPPEVSIPESRQMPSAKPDRQQSEVAISQEQIIQDQARKTDGDNEAPDSFFDNLTGFFTGFQSQDNRPLEPVVKQQSRVISETDPVNPPVSEPIASLEVLEPPAPVRPAPSDAAEIPSPITPRTEDVLISDGGENFLKGPADQQKKPTTPGFFERLENLITPSEQVKNATRSSSLDELEIFDPNVREELQASNDNRGSGGISKRRPSAAVTAETPVGAASISADVTSAPSSNDNSETSPDITRSPSPGVASQEQVIETRVSKTDEDHKSAASFFDNLTGFFSRFRSQENRPLEPVVKQQTRLIPEPDPVNPPVSEPNASLEVVEPPAPVRPAPTDAAEVPSPFTPRTEDVETSDSGDKILTGPADQQKKPTTPGFFERLGNLISPSEQAKNATGSSSLDELEIFDPNVREETHASNDYRGSGEISKRRPGAAVIVDTPAGAAASISADVTSAPSSHDYSETSPEVTSSPSPGVASETSLDVASETSSVVSSLRSPAPSSDTLADIDSETSSAALSDTSTDNDFETSSAAPSNATADIDTRLSSAARSDTLVISDPDTSPDVVFDRIPKPPSTGASGIPVANPRSGQFAGSRPAPKRAKVNGPERGFNPFAKLTDLILELLPDNKEVVTKNSATPAIVPQRATSEPTLVAPRKAAADRATREYEIADLTNSGDPYKVDPPPASTASTKQEMANIDPVGDPPALPGSQDPVETQPPSPRPDVQLLLEKDLVFGDRGYVNVPLEAAAVPAENCVIKRAWDSHFCIQEFQWPAEIQEAFGTHVFFSGGGQTIVHYVGGYARQYHGLFPTRSYDSISAFLTSKYGPPTATPEIWTAFLAEPKRLNRTRQWIATAAGGGADIILEVREIDDLRWSSPPDKANGVIRMYRRDEPTIFRLLTTADLLLLQVRKGSHPGLPSLTESQ